METTMDYFNNNNICHSRKDIARLKSSLTLDVNCGRSSGNGIDLSFSGRLEDGLLSTPDVGLLKLATPELELLVLQQYIQQQQHLQQELSTDSCLDQHQVQLSLGNDGRSPFPAAVGEVSKFDAVSGAVELRRSVDQRHNATVVVLPPQHDRHFVGSLLELGSCGRDDQSRTAAAASSNASSSVARQPSTAADVSANAWPRDFYDQPSVTRPVSDHVRFTSSTVPQFSPSSSSAGAAPTPPPKAERRRSAMVKSGDRLPVSTPASLCSDFSADDVEWPPSAGKRPCYYVCDKDENDSVSSVSGSLTTMAVGVETPPISPIDMAEQERIKLERKRARNRQAATRCRNRKLERIATLQDQADRLRATNSQLTAEVTRLRNTVCQLRRDVARHSAAGCQPLGATTLIPPAFPVLHQHQAFSLNAAVGVNGQCFEPVL